MQVTNTFPETMLSPFFTRVILRHRLYLVLAGPALWREQRVQPVGVGAGIGVRHDLTALFVVGCIGDPPPDLVGRKRDFKLRKELGHIQSRMGDVDASSVGMARHPPSGTWGFVELGCDLGNTGECTYQRDVSTVETALLAS